MAKPRKGVVPPALKKYVKTTKQMARMGKGAIKNAGKTKRKGA